MNAEYFFAQVESVGSCDALFGGMKREYSRARNPHGRNPHGRNPRIRHHRARYTHALLSCMILSALSGCAFLTPELQLRVVLPDEPCPWEEFFPVKWRIVYPSGNGKLKSRTVSARSTRIETARGLYVPVAAYPLGRLRPAGAFVSHSVEAKERLTGTRRLELSWEAGAAADLFLELWKEQEKLSRVDAFYLAAQMAAEGEGDPWACDLERIRSAVLFDSLSTIQISDADRYAAEFELSAADWICASPLFAGSIESVSFEAEAGDEPEDGSCEEGRGTCRVRFTGLYPGLHRFYSPSVELELHILVEKNGECRSICVTPR